MQPVSTLFNPALEFSSPEAQKFIHVITVEPESTLWEYKRIILETNRSK
jgi:hypothetical protein